MRRCVPFPHVSRVGLGPLAALLLAIFAGCPAAASFDCVPPRSDDPKAVCADPGAAKGDAAIAAAYAQARRRLAGREAALALLDRWRREFLAGGETALAFRKDRQLALLSAVDGRPRRGFMGAWAAEFGTVTFRPDPDRPGFLSVEIDFAQGAPPSFNICSWQGGGVREHARRAVATAADENWKVAFERDGPILRLRDLSAARKGAPNPLPYCSKANELDAVLIAVAEDTTTAEASAVSIPAPKGEPKAKIDDLLPVLPASIFDHPTDGVGAAELKSLIATGESGDWRLERLSDRKARFVSRGASREVTLRLKMMGARELLEVAIRRGRVSTLAYLARKEESSALEPFQMRQALRVLLDVSAPGEGWPDVAIPGPLADFADAADACAQFARAPGGSMQEKAQARDSMRTLGCDRLAARAAQLGRLHAGDRLWKTYLARARGLAGR